MSHVSAWEATSGNPWGAAATTLAAGCIKFPVAANLCVRLPARAEDVGQEQRMHIYPRMCIARGYIYTDPLLFFMEVVKYTLTLLFRFCFGVPPWGKASPLPRSGVPPLAYQAPSPAAPSLIADLPMISRRLAPQGLACSPRLLVAANVEKRLLGSWSAS